MPQTSPPFCSTCGTSVPAGQRFCPNCGAAVGSDANSPTVSAGGGQTYQADSNVQNPQVYAPTVLEPGNQANQAQGGLQTPASYSSTIPASSGSPYIQNSSGQELPPPPPPDSLVQTPQQALNTIYPSRSSSYYSSPTQQNTPPLPDYARVQKRSPLRRFITFVSFLLILALLVGGILFLITKFT